MLFPLGRVVATRNCLHVLLSINGSAVPYLERHQRGDWGILSHADRDRNDRAVVDGGRILSKYLLKGGTPIYVITEADRSVTTVMLVGDY